MKNVKSLTKTTNKPTEFTSDFIPRSETRLDYYTEDCVYIPEGKLFIECKIPSCRNREGETEFKVYKSHKYFMYAYFNNFIIINRVCNDLEFFINHANYVNSVFLTKPMDVSELDSMISILFDDKDILEPINAKLKYHWVNPKALDKKSALAQSMKFTKSDYIYEIMEILPMFEHKVTLPFIAEYFNKSVKNIKDKLTDDMKLALKEHNKKYNKR